jgi:membrane protein required for beta-lactamase induction
MTQDFEERFKRLEQEVNRDAKTNAGFKWKTPANLSVKEGSKGTKGSFVQEWLWLAVAILVVLVLGRMVLGMAFGLVFMLLNLAVFAAIIAGVFTIFRLFKK